MHTSLPVNDPAVLAAWFNRVLDYVESKSSAREVRRGRSGPLAITHTFQPDSSHAQLMDGVAGPWPDSGAPALTIHSIERPPRELMVPAPIRLTGQWGSAPGLERTRWRVVWDGADGDAWVFDRVRGIGLLVTNQSIPVWQLASPFMLFLHWAAAALGAAVLHAGTVGTREGMLLVPGPGGRGKSTTVLVGLHDGLNTCGDDYVWVERNGSDWCCRSLFRVIKTKAGAPYRPPAIEYSRNLDAGAKQAHWLLSTPGNGGLLDSAPICGIGLLGDPAQGAKPPTGALVATLAQSTTQHFPYDAASVLRIAVDLARTMPQHSLPRTGDYDVLRVAIRGVTAGTGQP
jgi:hypothetical protein